MKVQNWIGVAVLVLVAWVTIIQMDVSNVYDFLSGQPSSARTQGIFTTKETGFYPVSDIRTGQVFLISLKEVVPYVNGYKLKFVIGNISSADYEGVTLNYSWGESAYSSGEMETVKVTKKLLAGVWNKVTIIASPVNKSDLERIILSIDTGAGTIILKDDLRK